MERTYPPEWLVALVIVAFGAKAERLTEQAAQGPATNAPPTKTIGSRRRRDVRPPRAC